MYCDDISFFCDTPACVASTPSTLPPLMSGVSLRLLMSISLIVLVCFLNSVTFTSPSSMAFL